MNELQKSQIPVLERVESGRPVLRAYLQRQVMSTESGGPGGSQACDQAEPSQGQLKSFRAELSFPAGSFPTLWVSATSSLPAHS